MDNNDQVTQSITEYLDSLVNDVLDSPHFASFADDKKAGIREQLDLFLNDKVMEILINNLSDDQLAEAQNLDLESEEGTIKLQMFAAEIPGFFVIVDENLKSEVDNIKTTGQIPVVE